MRECAAGSDGSSPLTVPLADPAQIAQFLNRDPSHRRSGEKVAEGRMRGMWPRRSTMLFSIRYEAQARALCATPLRMSVERQSEGLTDREPFHFRHTAGGIYRSPRSP